MFTVKFTLQINHRMFSVIQLEIGQLGRPEKRATFESRLGGVVRSQLRPAGGAISQDFKPVCRRMNAALVAVACGGYSCLSSQMSASIVGIFPLSSWLTATQCTYLKQFQTRRV